MTPGPSKCYLNETLVSLTHTSQRLGTVRSVETTIVHSITNGNIQTRLKGAPKQGLDIVLRGPIRLFEVRESIG